MNASIARRMSRDREIPRLRASAEMIWYVSSRTPMARGFGFSSFIQQLQYDDGEAKRDDENFCYVAAWEFKGAGQEPELHKEPLKFENVHLAVRSYK